MADKSKLGVGDFTDVGVNLVQSLLDPDASAASRGSGIGGAVGAGIGAAFLGPAGAQIGGSLGGLVGGAIGGKTDKSRATTKMRDVMNKKYGALDVAYNANPYGDGSTFYAEDGLALPEIGSPVQVNIEKNELLVDPATMEVKSKFGSKRYKPHAKNKANEHFGNFITMDPSHVIIPKKKAEAFEKGDRITRRSIIAQIMQDQDENGVETNNQVAYAEKGYVAGDPTQPISLKKLAKYAPAMPVDDLTAPLDLSIVSVPKTRSVVTKAPTVVGPKVSATPIVDVKPETKGKKAKAMDYVNYGVNKVGNAIDQIPDINDVKAAQMQMALPTIVGLGQAMQNDPFLRYDENSQIDAAKSYVQQIPVDENLEGVKAQAARTQAAYIKQMGNFNTPSSRGEITDMIAKTDAATQGVIAESQNRRVQRIANKLGLLADMEQKQGEGRLQSRNKFALESSQDRGVRQGIIQQGLSELVTNRGKMVMDNERIKSINAMLKYNTVAPGGKTVIAENAEALQNVFNQLGEYAGGPTLPSTGNRKKVSTTTTETYDRNRQIKGSKVSQTTK